MSDTVTIETARVRCPTCLWDGHHLVVADRRLLCAWCGKSHPEKESVTVTWDEHAKDWRVVRPTPETTP